MGVSRWPRFAVFLAVAAVLAVAPGLHSQPREPAKVKDELKQLQGTWTLLAYAVDGKQFRGEDARSSFTIEDNRWTGSWRKDAGGEQVEQGKLQIIDATGQPKVMDLFHDFGPYKGTTTRVLYQVDEDSMRFSIVVVPPALGDAKVVTGTTTWKRKPR